MKNRLINYSIVISGNLHNPTIINRDFLSIQGIIPKEWNWEVEDDGVITTPPLAQVPYSNGVVIQVEPHKAQFSEKKIEDPGKSKIANIATQFARTLKYVKYGAVGINFRCLFEIPSPEEFIQHRFLQNGKWNNSRHPIKAVGFRFVFEIQEGKVTISLDAGTAKISSENSELELPVVIVDANFHRECTDYPADDQIEAYLKCVDNDWNLFQTIANDLLS